MINGVAAATTTFLGINDNGDLVGNYVDGNDVSHGLLCPAFSNNCITIADPNESANPAFDITNTIVNGINDAGDLVGFYSDGTNVNGFLATPVPEPASLGLAGFAAIALFGALRRRETKS